MSFEEYQLIYCSLLSTTPSGLEAHREGGRAGSVRIQEGGLHSQLSQVVTLYGFSYPYFHEPTCSGTSLTLTHSSFISASPRPGRTPWTSAAQVTSGACCSRFLSLPSTISMSYSEPDVSTDDDEYYRAPSVQSRRRAASTSVAFTPLPSILKPLGGIVTEPFLRPLPPSATHLGAIFTPRPPHLSTIKPSGPGFTVLAASQVVAPSMIPQQTHRFDPLISLKRPAADAPVQLLVLGSGSSAAVPDISCVTSPETGCEGCLKTLSPDGCKNIRGNTGAVLRIPQTSGREK